MHITRRMFLASSAAFVQRRRPNIVFFLSDDQGPWAWSRECSEIATPNLDRLAASGMTFTRAFAATPVCSPSRMTLMTGLLPSQHGVQDYLLPEECVGSGARRYLDGHRTWTMALKEAGYTLGLSGKWHMGDDATPQQGFSFWATVPGGGGTYRDAPFVKNGEAIRSGGYKTDQQGDYALEFLRAQEQRGGPFCLYVPFYAPHTPYDFQPERDRDLYAGSRFSCYPRLPVHPRQHPGLRSNHLQEESMRSYSALVSGMDYNIGRVLDRIERMGAREDTIVIFTADQGWNAGHHGVWGKGNGTIPFNLYEESIRVPMIWSEPGRVRAGAHCAAMVSHYDFPATLLEMAGVTAAMGRSPGRSYASLLRGRGELSREALYSEYAYVRGRRTTSTKTIVRAGYESEHYDLAADPAESENLWTGRAKERGVAERRIGAFFRQLGAPPLERWRETTTQKLPGYPSPA